MSDDQDGCEWVNVLLVPAYPGSPGQTAVKRLCVLSQIVCTEGTETVQITAEENSSIFSLIRMRCLPSARACRQ